MYLSRRNASKPPGTLLGASPPKELPRSKAAKPNIDGVYAYKDGVYA